MSGFLLHEYGLDGYRVINFPMVFDNEAVPDMGGMEANGRWFMQAGCAPVCEYLA